MSLPRRSAFILGGGAALAFVLLAAGCFGSADTPREVQGWIEGDFIFISPDEIGRIEKLSVKEGTTVSRGADLFALDDDLQQAAVAEADAALENAKITFERAKDLLKRAVGSQKTFDDAQAALRTAEAHLNTARTRLKRRRISSPVDGVVQEIYFRVGELVQSGRPILSVLPPQNIKVRFFVAQAELPTLHIGDTVTLSCDGCAAGLTAHITFLSAQAEFTPPLIYSQEERGRLVFRVEAHPDTPAKLRVGQPITVGLPVTGGISRDRGNGGT